MASSIDMRIVGQGCLSVLVALCLCSCEAPPSSVLQAAPEDAAQFYEEGEVWHIDIRLDDSGLSRLREQPRFYVEGDVRIGDELIRDVGVRLKGQFSFQGLGGKPSFKIKFNSYVDNQRFLGLEKLTLNNMRQDRSQVHEWLGYRVFAALGVPASRSSYARVTVNGEPYGLYANVETMDDRFLVNRFGSVGNLYEAPWGADLDAESIDLYEQDEGEDTSRQDLDDLLDQLQGPGDDVFFGEHAAINTEEFLRFVVSEAAIGHWDGYWKSNNYFLYHDLERNTWSFHPWGLDQSFDRALHPFTSAGVLAQRCLATTSCRSEYARIGLELAQLLEDLPLADELDDLVFSLEPYIDQDPRSPHPLGKVQRFQELTRAHLENTPRRLQAHYSCIERGVERDRDGDGYLACESDCDDNDPASYPRASELCDGKDNDCDGSIDEVGCDCVEQAIAGSLFYFCNQHVPWLEARSGCEARALRLAHPGSSSVSKEVFSFAESLAAEQSWYLGVNDRDEEGSWRTATAEALGFTNFGPGEPDDFGDEDCAVLASFGYGDWADETCSTALPYICEELR